MSWPSVLVLGVRVDDLPLEALLESFDELIQSKGKSVFGNVNVHAINLAWDLPWLRVFLNSCDPVFCDGAGVRLGAWLTGHRLKHRNTIPDWFSLLCDRAQFKGHSMYFLGSRDGIAAMAAAKVRASFPDLRIVGTHHGYFDHRMDSQDNAEVVRSINETSPDILLVAMGMPLQEAWIRDHLHELEAHVILPVGALLDYVSGRLRRPPAWMSKNGFEWLGRLILEPRRLWRRYLIGNPMFLWRILKQRFGSTNG
jgi:N-acetylglucosaminyldiphosphoundecaprenol N-acetyl-beta-D-mannosaminyltransferase